MERLLGCSLAAILGLGVAACDTEPRGLVEQKVVAGGEAQFGGELMVVYGCVACHDVEGVRSVKGRTGPPLRRWSRRQMVAGQVPNTPDNLVRFIQDPQGVAPGIAMPNLDVSDSDARDIAAYLYTLR